MIDVDPQKTELVSDAYYEALAYPDTTPAYSMWLMYRGPESDTVPSLWNEEAIMAEVRRMLTAASSIFSIVPDSVDRLRSVYVKADRGGDHYLRYALSVQGARLSTSLESIGSEADIRKLAAKIQRGIERRLAEVAMLDSEDYYDTALDSRTRVRRRRPVGTSRLVNAIMAPLELTFKIEDRIDRLMNEISRAEIALDRLGYRLEIIEVVKKMIDTTRSRLDELGGPIDFTGSAPKSQHSFSTLEEIRGDAELKDEKPARPAKRKARQGDRRRRSGSDQSPKEEASNDFSAEAIAISKLRDSIELAIEHGRLRIVVPHEGSSKQYFEKKWQELISKLGYSGKIEFVHFTDLGRTRDFSSPVVLAQSMNTHNNLWDRSRFSNCFVIDVNSPNRLIKYLDTQDA